MHAEEAALLERALRPSEPAEVLDGAVASRTLGGQSRWCRASAPIRRAAPSDRRRSTATPVIFLDTGKHFGETLGYRDALSPELGLTDVRIVEPPPKHAWPRIPDGKL